MGFIVTIIIISLLFSAFFSGMEIAYVTANKVRLSIHGKKNSFISGILTYLMHRPGKFIAGMLIGNNIALVIYGYYMGLAIILLMFPEYQGNEALPIWLLLIQTLVSTVIILVTGEFLPKAIFRAYAEELLRFFAIPVYLLYKLFEYLGITGFVLWLSNFMITKILKGKKSGIENASLDREDLGDYIEERIENLDSKQLEEIDNQIHIFRNALDFHDLKARECMVPRTEIFALEVGASVDELRGLFIETGFSKILIYRGNIDDVIGYVHSFELFKPALSIRELIMPVEFIPETMPVNDVLNLLTKKRKSIAVVIDEYGGTAGMITVEDIVEELVGEIEDEHDTDDTVEEKIDENNFLFSARLEVDYLNKEYGLCIPECNEYETLGGFILSHTENIPYVGEVLRIENLEITVKSASQTKIDTVQVQMNCQLPS